MGWDATTAQTICWNRRALFIDDVVESFWNGGDQGLEPVDGDVGPHLGMLRPVVGDVGTSPEDAATLLQPASSFATTEVVPCYHQCRVLLQPVSHPAQPASCFCYNRHHVLLGVAGRRGYCNEGYGGGQLRRR